jgi:hypothetical protein
MIDSNGTEMTDNAIAPLFTTGVIGSAQSAAVRTNNWKTAMSLYMNQGVVTQDFLDRLVEIRAIWHKTHLKYTFDEGETSLEDLWENLIQFIPHTKVTGKENMMKYLFGKKGL